MNVLHLLRHAKSVAQDPAGDRERGLEDRGRQAAHAIAGWMAEHKVSPRLVLCSDALRTRQTLGIVLPALPRGVRVLHEEALYLASARQMLVRLRQIPPETERVLVIGHNPGMHELASLLTDVTTGPQAARLAEGFPTAALASFEVPMEWSGLDRQRARLTAFVTPKELKRGLA
jgi:phosphohistidine phosphatase